MQEGTHFIPVIGDAIVKNAKKIIFMSGKFYYDLVAEREKRGLQDVVAIIRIEELCPFPWSSIESIVNQYSAATDFVWVQEEPQNQGAWSYLEPRLNQILPKQVFTFIFLYLMD